MRCTAHLQEAYAELKVERMEASGDGLPTIIYSSRTHSQLKQVMGELASTSYHPRTAVLGSRQQGCLNPAVNQLPSGGINHACRALTSKRGCKWWVHDAQQFHHPAWSAGWMLCVQLSVRCSPQLKTQTSRQTKPHATQFA